MDIYSLVRQAVAAPIADRDASDVHIPGRHAACSLYAPALGKALSPEAFPAVLGVPAVRETSYQNSWLSVALTDAFYSACVRRVRETLPTPTGDCGSFALNRMLALSRQGGTGCPPSPDIQRALWLLIGAADGYHAMSEAVQVWQRMLYPLPVRERMKRRRICGEMADASARLYIKALSLSSLKNTGIGG